MVGKDGKLGRVAIRSRSESCRQIAVAAEGGETDNRGRYCTSILLSRY